MVDELNAWLSQVTLECRLTLERGRVMRRDDLASGRIDRRLAGRLALALAELITTLEPQRVKVCPNPLCRWIYYDRTRGNVQRWCCLECGNRAKVRRYRARLKQLEREEAGAARRRRERGRTPA